MIGNICIKIEKLVLVHVQYLPIPTSKQNKSLISASNQYGTNILCLSRLYPLRIGWIVEIGRLISVALACKGFSQRHTEQHKSSLCSHMPEPPPAVCQCLWMRPSRALAANHAGSWGPGERHRLQRSCLSWEAGPLSIILPIKTVQWSTFLSKIRCPDPAGPDSLQLTGQQEEAERLGLLLLQCSTYADVYTHTQSCAGTDYMGSGLRHQIAQMKYS